MSLPRFFLTNQVLSLETDAIFPLRLDSDDMKHARALRLGSGEHIGVIDAASDYFECEVIDFEDLVRVRISQRSETPAQGAQVILLQGLAKGSKFDEIIRHATEIGVSAFVPLICQRCVVRYDQDKAAKRLARWEAVAKSAAMQSGRDFIPKVTPPCTIDEALRMLKGVNCVLVCWEEAHSLSLATALKMALSQTRTPPADARVAVVVGPEGGLTETEVEMFKQSNTHAYIVSLGPSILRTETAGLLAPALAIHELGGLQ